MMDDHDDEAGRYGLAGSGDDAPGGGESGGGSSGGGGSAGGGGVKIPRHDFVSKLVKDPSNLSADEGMVILNGWVGDSDEDGFTRLYCEPTLDCYADVRDEDILHHEDSPEVGSVVWAKRNAQVRYGRRGEGKKEASSFFSGQLLQDYRGGAQGGAAGGGQNLQNTIIGPTGWHYCSILTCPPTSIDRCGVLPVSMGCPQGGGGGGAQAAAANVGPTGWLGCTQPGHCVGPTGWLGCTQGLGCPGTSTCPPQQGTGDAAGGPIGVTGWQGCTHMLGCPSTSTCPPTHLLGCGPRTSDCPPTYMPGCPSSSTCPPQGGGANALAAAPGGGQSTAATLCTQIGCAHITLLTQIGCGPGPVIRTFMPGCPSSSTCPPQEAAGAQSTAATLCTQIGCGHATIHPTIWTQIHCPPTQMLGCPSTSTCPPGGGSGQLTIATVCTQLHCPGPATYSPGCTLGFTCTYVGCQQ